MKSQGHSAIARQRGVTRQTVRMQVKRGTLKITPKTGTDSQWQAERPQPNPSRQVRDFYQAKMAKLEFEQATGKLIEADRVQAEAFRVGRLVRDSILNVPDRIAGLLAAETDQFKVHAMLTKELQQALEALTRTP